MLQKEVLNLKGMEWAQRCVTINISERYFLLSLKKKLDCIENGSIDFAASILNNYVNPEESVGSSVSK